MTRYLLCLLALLAIVLARRSREWRPIAIGISVLAVIDLIRIWTRAWPAIDAGLVAAWPGVVAWMAWVIWGEKRKGAAA